VNFARAKVGDRYVLETAAAARLAVRRRELRPPAVPRLPHHRRRHDQRAAGAGRDARSGRTLAQLTADLTLYPQSLINVKARRAPSRCCG
jgi:hypothetical protein